MRSFRKGQTPTMPETWSIAFEDQPLRGALDVVWKHWTHTPGAVNVETPDQSLDMLTNG